MSTSWSARRTNLPAAVHVLLAAVLAVSSAAAAGETATAPAIPPAAAAPTQWWFAARWENDMFGGTDWFYTDGGSLSLSHAGSSWLDGLADALPWGRGRRIVSYELGQIMVTPSDITLATPDPEDRPYAGILFLGVSLHVDRGNRYHGLKFLTGVVGPWSFAEETQEEVHRWTDTDQPQGWHHQLENEPILNLVYEHRRKFQLLGGPRTFALEALPVGSVMLGNVLTQAQIGGQLRFGYNLPDDFGATLMRGMGYLPPPRRPSDAAARSKLGVCVYGGANVNLVIRNITLDGNTWQDSPSVEKKLVVPVGEVGFAVTTDEFTLSFSYLFWGREFEGQADYSKFGAVALSFPF